MRRRLQYTAARCAVVEGVPWRRGGRISLLASRWWRHLAGHKGNARVALDGLGQGVTDAAWHRFGTFRGHPSHRFVDTCSIVGRFVFCGHRSRALAGPFLPGAPTSLPALLNAAWKAVLPGKARPGIGQMRSASPMPWACSKSFALLRACKVPAWFRSTKCAGGRFTGGRSYNPLRGTRRRAPRGVHSEASP